MRAAYLPKATSTHGRCWPTCPWCKTNMEDATVRLVDLVDAWDEGQCDWPERLPGGLAGSPLTVDCPTCGRPSMVALSGTSTSPTAGCTVRIVPVRTRSDAVFLGVVE